MEVPYQPVSLSVNAKEFLFENYRTTQRIFREVLGHFDLDYLGMTLINQNNELIFLSSRPSIECNLIEKNIWQQDILYHSDLFEKNKVYFWDEIYNGKNFQELRFYKMTQPDFKYGFSILTTFEELRVFYSFATRSKDLILEKKMLTDMDDLIRLGRYCLIQIMKTIPLPNRQQVFSMKKPMLKLIVNNTEEISCKNY